MSLNKTHHYVSKGWGYEIWIANNEKYCGKILHIVKGKKTSWHYHNIKDEVLYVKSGRITFTHSPIDNPRVQSTFTIMEEGDSFHVPVGLRHQLHALVDSEIIEISTQHFDEDSIRVAPGD
jgi:mannose-6-phosphate isomerase-like protein (cupin superfamily)